MLDSIPLVGVFSKFVSFLTSFKESGLQVTGFFCPLSLMTISSGDDAGVLKELGIWLSGEASKVTATSAI